MIISVACDRTMLPNSRQRDHFAGILDRVGDRPGLDDHEALSFWAVCSPFLPGPHLLTLLTLLLPLTAASMIL